VADSVRRRRPIPPSQSVCARLAGSEPAEWKAWLLVLDARDGSTTPDETMYASGVDAGSSGLEYPAHGEWPDVRRRVAPPSHDLVIEIATRLAYRVPGNIIEFGMFKGRSTRVLRRALHQLQRGQLLGPRKEIFACDSFKGLPEKYENLGVGAFACAPPSIPGVHIVEGYFEDSLTPELARRVGRVALASLDADLYSSTLCALRWLTPQLHTGSLLLFDEYLGGGAGERRAHEDWVRETGLRTVRVAEFLRESSGQGGNRDHGSTPDRRVVFQVVGAAELVTSKGFLITDARRLSRGALRRLTRWARIAWRRAGASDAGRRHRGLRGAR
jgi:Macrocin-O-methyltransferase (TylF)